MLEKKISVLLSDDNKKKLLTVYVLTYNPLNAQNTGKTVHQIRWW